MLSGRIVDSFYDSTNFVCSGCTPNSFGTLPNLFGATPFSDLSSKVFLTSNNWDFTNIWGFLVEGADLPLLQFQIPPTIPDAAVCTQVFGTPGLISYWTFEGGPAGSTIIDNFNGNNGTVTGTISTVPGQVGDALEFDSAEKIEFTNVTHVNTSGGSYTITAWFNTNFITPLTNAQQILFTSFGGGASNILRVDLDVTRTAAAGNNTREFGFFDRSSVTVGKGFGVDVTPFSDGQWHHVAFVFDGVDGEAKLYVDGRRMGNTVPYSPVTISGAARIASHNYVGSYDEVAIFERTLTTDEILSMYDTTKNARNYCNTPVCGDSVIQVTETCDDGCLSGVPNVCEAVDDGDGCSSTCEVEPTFDPLNCPANLISYWTLDSENVIDNFNGNDGTVIGTTPKIFEAPPPKLVNKIC